MLFVRVGNYHINMESVSVYQWVNGSLLIFDRSLVPFTLNDPDKTKYKKLCESIGVRPVEEE